MIKKNVCRVDRNPLTKGARAFLHSVFYLEGNKVVNYRDITDDMVGDVFFVNHSSTSGSVTELPIIQNTDAYLLLKCKDEYRAFHISKYDLDYRIVYENKEILKNIPSIILAKSILKL